MTEQYAATAEKQASPVIEVDSERLARLESLLWAKADEVVISEEELDGPIRNITIAIDGSPDVDGGFGFGATMKLGETPHEDEDPDALKIDPENLLQFVGNFVNQWPNQPLKDARNSFFLRGFGNSTFVLAVGDNMREIMLGSCDNVDENEPITKEDLRPLQHGKHSSIPEFNQFRSTLSKFLGDFYDEFGHPDRTVLKTHVPLTDAPLGSEATANRQDIKYPTMNDIGGLDEVKRRLMEYVEDLRHPEILAKYGAELRSGVLLSGPSDGGKTMLVNAFANEIDADLVTLNSSMIYSGQVGGSEKALQALFEAAMVAEKPTILYFNNIEGIILPNSNGSTEAKVAAVFKQYAEKVHGHPKVILWADTTKQLQDLGDGILLGGKFDIKEELPKLDESGLAAVIGRLIMHNFEMSPTSNFEHETINYKALAKAAHAKELTGGSLAEIMNNLVADRARHEIRQAQLDESERTAPPVITHKRMLQAIQRYRFESGRT